MKFYYSIHTRLTSIAFVFIIGTSVCMAIIGMRITTRFLNAKFHENFRLLSEYMSRNAELGVLLQDKEMLLRLVKNMLDQKDIYSVSIVSSDGKVLASLTKDLPPKSNFVKIETMINMLGMNSDDQIYEYQQPENIGKVILTYSLGSLEQLKKELSIKFILISVFLAIFPVAWYWIVAKSITAPLKNLLKVAKRVSQGNMEIRAKGGNLLETRTLAATFNEMLDVLNNQRRELKNAYTSMAQQKALAEVGKFSMMIAHEVKNPLSIIKGSLELLKKDNLQADVKANMMIYLEEEVSRINHLMEDFLLYARPKEPNFIEIEINGFIKDIVSKVESLHQGNGINVEILVSKEPCILAFDPNLMERAVQNIIINAFKMCKTDDLIEILTVVGNNAWKFIVKDSGPGILPENLSRIFDPFFTTRAKGSGLGLAMTKEIIDLHGGEIRAINRKKGGACFQIRLPKM